MAPVMPFSGTNLLMAASQVQRLPFALGTLIGFAPIALLMALVGATAADLHIGQQAQPEIWISLAFLAASVVGLGWIARRRLRIL